MQKWKIILKSTGEVLAEGFDTLYDAMNWGTYWWEKNSPREEASNTASPRIQMVKEEHTDEPHEPKRDSRAHRLASRRRQKT